MSELIDCEVVLWPDSQYATNQGNCPLPSFWGVRLKLGKTV